MKLDGHFLLLLSVAVFVFVPTTLPVATANDATADDATASPRANLMNHWLRLFPATTELPQGLIKRSSPLTASQVATFSSYIDTHTLNDADHLSAFCSAANILCSTNLPHEGYMDVIPNAGFILSETNWTKRDFFREASIAAGREIRIPDIREKMPTSFLPKDLSDKLPFSSKSLPGLVQLLRLGRLQRGMSITVSTCELAPNQGKDRACVRSLEDLVDLAVVMLGQKSEAWLTQSSDGWGQDVMVESLVGTNTGKETIAMACHRMMFPYLVYYCHVFSNVKVYNAELRIGDGTTEKRNRVVVVCHMDTSKWPASHPAFQVLGSGPGKFEVCHFMYEGEITWAAQN